MTAVVIARYKRENAICLKLLMTAETFSSLPTKLNAGSGGRDNITDPFAACASTGGKDGITEPERDKRL
jgi:hypothetical protein